MTLATSSITTSRTSRSFVRDLAGLATITVMAVIGYLLFPDNLALLTRIIGIALLVLVVIPAISKIEARWEALTRQPLGPAEIVTHFRRERRRLWLAAVTMPFVWTGLFLGIYMGVTRLAG